MIRARPFGVKRGQDGGVFDFTGQMRARRGGVFGCNHHHAGAIGQRHARRRDFARAGGGGIFNALRAEEDAPSGGISTQPKPMPAAQRQGRAQAKLPVTAGPNDARHWPMRPDRQRHASPRLFFADNRGFCAGLCLEPDECGPGGWPGGSRRRLGDQRIGPKPDRLVAALKFGIETGSEVLKPQPRPGRVGVAGNHAAQPRPVAPAAWHADLHRQAFARARGKPVQIAGDGQFGGLGFGHGWVLSLMGMVCALPSAVNTGPRGQARLICARLDQGNGSRGSAWPRSSKN